MKKPIKLPKFKNEDEERRYWADIDLTKYLEPKDFKKAMFPNLKPTTQPISIRLPKHVIYSLKVKANKNNIPYQSLIKTYIDEGLSK